VPEPLIALEHVTRSFVAEGRPFTVVEDVSLEIAERETICLVGESGCGKTTAGKLLTGLLAPSSGRVLYRGRYVEALRGAERRAYRLGVQLVHQDPFASLNPTKRVGDILAAPLRRHGRARGDAAIRRRVIELLEVVDLTPADDLVGKYPHQLSGGQRQRVSIARALTVEPAFIVADEAVSMVDVSIRVSLLNTLRRLRDDMGLAVLLITHDLALGRHFAGTGRIGVMYLGRLVELGTAPELVAHPKHPYTEALLAAAPHDPRSDHRDVVAAPALRSAEVPSVLARPTGCPFHPRCPLFETGLCDVVVPELLPLTSGVRAACHPVARRYGLGGSSGSFTRDDAEFAPRTGIGLPMS
jgi:oligopeptide/dipeptide ABC transporter ATP-binding protein